MNLFKRLFSSVPLPDPELESRRSRLKQLDDQTSRINSAYGMLADQIESTVDKIEHSAAPTSSMDDTDSTVNHIDQSVAEVRKSILFLRDPNKGKMAGTG